MMSSDLSLGLACFKRRKIREHGFRQIPLYAFCGARQPRVSGGLGAPRKEEALA